ncbi:RNA exonuclease 1 homolog [Aulostomus maculatus]
MFPSSGFFVKITCPFSKRGQCVRPHCPYKHAPGERNKSCDSNKSSVVDVAGVQNSYRPPVSGPRVIDEGKGDSLQELERLDKEIASVRHEVEQERRRLSHYQCVKADTAPHISSPKSDTANRNVNSDSCVLPSSTICTKRCSQSTKYVVDNSKPRTDLEYDPMSNFSADFRSYRSSVKVKNSQDFKRASTFKQNPTAQLSPLPCPEPLDEPYGDGTLIIDISPSPDRKRIQAQKLVESSPDIQLDKLKELEQTRQSAVFPDSPDTPAPTVSANRHFQACVVENNPESSNLDQNEEHEIVAGDGCVIDLTGSLENLEGESQKMNSFKAAEIEVVKNLVPASPPEQDQAMEKEKICVELPQNEISCRIEDPLQRHNLPHKNSHYSKTSSTCTTCTQKIEQPGQCTDCQHCSPEPSAQKPVSGTPGQTQGKVSFCYASPDAHLEPAGSPPGSSQHQTWHVASVRSGLKKGNELSSVPPTEQFLVKSDNAEVIIIGSSSDEDEDEYNYSGAELSDSDPMEECYRIFMEANEERAHEEQPPVSVEPTEVEKAEVNVTQRPQGKKRMAHEAKHTEKPVAKRPQPQVLVPLREPAAPGSLLSTTSKFRQVQQRASMWTGSVKGGQAYVSSTCQRRQEIQTTAPPPPQASATPQPNPVQNARKPSCVTTFSTSANLPTPQAPAKPGVLKRKGKQLYEAAKDKVPHDIRQRFVNKFTEEFLKVNASDAFEKALAAERSIYNRSMNKVKYLSVAVNALKRLKNQNTVASKDDETVSGKLFRGNIPLNLKKLKGNDDMALYKSFKDYILTEEKLIENNYPVQHPEKPSHAVLFADNKKGNNDPLKRICCRCGAMYSVSKTGQHIRKEECNYHYGKGVEKRVPGGVETRYSCCEGVMGAPGCQVFKLHVHDSISLEGFVATAPRPPTDMSCAGVYSLDCEMCYTIHGLELSRVTVVNSSLQVVYDTFVRPVNEVIDYNTRFTGIGVEDVKGNCTSLTEVQKTLLSFVSANTILIGHGLEKDLCALKLLHMTVVDTSVVFPHRLGPPYKLTLNRLTAEYLRRIIQERVCGHDTAEDAAACMELMLWKIKDGKQKK